MAIASILSEEDVIKVHSSRSSADFGRIEFLEIVHVEDPKILYKSAGKHFFFVAGLAVGTSECKDSDFGSGRVLLPWIAQQSLGQQSAELLGFVS
ncbi:MAG: hypothetical protein OK456_00800 [Thaumarchaeota archaeon]|nr:hypothetical protein [Nitrososphaerota archaeon]